MSTESFNRRRVTLLKAQNILLERQVMLVLYSPSYYLTSTDCDSERSD